MSTWNTCVGLAFVLAGIMEVVAARHDKHCSVHDESYENFEGENVNERDREPSQTNLRLSFNILHNQARINDLEGIKGRLKSLLKLGGGFPSSSSLSPACYSFCSSDNARFRCDVADSTRRFFCRGQWVHSCVITSLSKDTKCSNYSICILNSSCADACSTSLTIHEQTPPQPCPLLLYIIDLHSLNIIYLDDLPIFKCGSSEGILSATRSDWSGSEYHPFKWQLHGEWYAICWKAGLHSIAWLSCLQVVQPDVVVGCSSAVQTFI